jgi:putative heme-binding domain-containing protein
MKLYHLLFFITLFFNTFCCAATKFELQEGDKVAFLGDGLMEREQYEGWLEIAFTTQFPDKNVTFRNLGWSGDTPAGLSRGGLSFYQAGFEPANEGWEQLKKQLATYKPNVVVLGYGTASSLPKGQTAEEFQRDLTQLLNETATATGQPVRFVILGAPSLLLKTTENQIHAELLSKINGILKAAATEKNIPFISLETINSNPAVSENGIHLTSEGYKATARCIEKELGWSPMPWDQGATAESLRKHILKKNEWFFNLSRPGNMAYIFGFRKEEQGKNAAEIPQFESLIKTQESYISKMRDLSKNIVIKDDPEVKESKVAANTKQEYPSFTVPEGFEISLWAENPMIHKPTSINFDNKGRLWVTSAETYPQVEVGQTPNDKIIILDDTDGDGKADKSTVFADGLLMPTSVLPTKDGCYVAQSTDLLLFKDTNQDDIADQKRRLISGFGTEDTHHNLHTLRRGYDGKIWMNQSVYTRTNAETPMGIMRRKGGGVMRYDENTTNLELIYTGLSNPWGHQFDRYGRSFLSDGANFNGIIYGLPGASYEGSVETANILNSISVGKYPKFCGLEIIESPNFPDEWQNNVITNDFRAHRVARFNIIKNGAGFAAQEAQEIVRSDSVNFRPIDLKIGPDGALYIADWANPIINHGEIDFRDPRRDREHGRIWRLTRKGIALTKNKNIDNLSSDQLINLLVSNHRYEREQAASTLSFKNSPKLIEEVKNWTNSSNDERKLMAALWFLQSKSEYDFSLLEKVLTAKNSEIRAVGVRVIGEWISNIGEEKSLKLLSVAIADESPLVRLEAARTLSKVKNHIAAFDVTTNILKKPMDSFLDYTLKLNVSEHGEEWLNALLKGKLDITKREKSLDYVLRNLSADKTNIALKMFMPKTLPNDGSGLWFKLAIESKDSSVWRTLFLQLTNNGFDAAATVTVIRNFTNFLQGGGSKPDVDFSLLLPFFDKKDKATLIAIIDFTGISDSNVFISKLCALAVDPSFDVEVKLSAINALSKYSDVKSKEILISLANDSSDVMIQQASIIALAKSDREIALPFIVKTIETVKEPRIAKQFWQEALSLVSLSSELNEIFKQKPLAIDIAVRALEHVPDVSKNRSLIETIRQQAGLPAIKVYTSEDVMRIAEQTKAEGNASRGELIYRRMEIACTSCHAIAGVGGKVGPDMTSIGASAPLDYLIESILLPSAKIKEGYHSVVIETNDGSSIAGTILRNINDGIVIRDATGKEITIQNNTIVKRTDSGSLMPTNLINNLEEHEKNDLFKFLSELGKQGDFDAPNSKAPKVWAVLPLCSPNMEPSTKGDPSQPWFVVNATVNGRLLMQDTNIEGNTEVLLATKLQLSSAAEVHLEFPLSKPTEIWIDGKSVTGKIMLDSGIHNIVIRSHKTKEFLMKCEQGTFLTTW